MTTELVTAHAGKNHVGSEDVGALYAGALGRGRFAFDVGERLAVTMTDANTVRIGTGVFLMDGRQVRVKEAEIVKVANGSQGTFRRDLVTYTYKRDPSNGNVEEGTWSVLQGTAAAKEDEAKAPGYAAGNILEGDLTATVAVAEVSLSGLTPTAKLLLPSVASLKTLGESVSQKVGVTYGVEDNDANLDNCTATGQYSLFNAKKAPIADWMNIYVMRFADNPNYVSQLAVSVTGAVYVRTRVRGTWKDWSKL